MDDKRITPVTPSRSWLKHNPNNQNENHSKRKEKRHKSSDKKSDQGNIIDDYA
jgi:hypothetical protein